MKLTGSCAPAVLGLSPHETPLQLYARLAGHPDPHEAIKSTRRQVEPSLLQMLRAERALGPGGPDQHVASTTCCFAHRFEAGECGPNCVCPAGQTSGHYWPAANPDGWSGDTLLIVKSCLWLTTEALAASPPWLTAIVQHELLATGAPRAALGVECAGGWFRTGWAASDPAYQAALLEAEAAFVARLERGEPPTPSGGAEELEAVRSLWPQDDASEVRLGSDAAERWAAIKRLRRVARESEQRAKTLEARLRAQAGAARTVRLPSGVRLSLATRADSAGRVSRRLVER